MLLEADFIIAPGLNTFDTHYFIVKNIPTRIKNYSALGNDSTIGQIYPNRAELNARFTNIDWALVREISIWAVSTNDPKVKKEIFYHDRIELQNVKELKLLSSLSDVKDLLTQDVVDLEIRMNFRTFTPSDIESRLTLNFVVHGKE